MHIKHYLVCDAPICQDDPNPNYKKEVIWLASEKVCTKFPYKKFQRKQIEINKLVAQGKWKKDPETPYTANDLETKSI